MSKTESVLCLGNFSTSTGYAWAFIAELYGAISRAATRREMRAWVGYPRMKGVPEALMGTGAKVVTLDWDEPLRLCWFALTHRVRVLYLTDRPSWNPRYALLRLAGVRRIVVHSHRAGGERRPTGLKRLAKATLNRLPWISADAVVAVSDFVAYRAREVGCVPPHKAHRVYNTLVRPGAPVDIRRAFDLPADRPVIVCAARASEEKGVHVLLHAAADLDASLVCFGDGPYMDALREIRDTLPHPERMVLAGYTPDAVRYVATADIAVVPSLCEEAFGLAALEAMQAGVPVVASNAGGLPEVVGGVGVLVPPGDVDGLRTALHRLLRDPEARRRMGQVGRERARVVFRPDATLRAIERLVLDGEAPTVGLRPVMVD